MNPKIDWCNIDTVLLDMDGTILDLSFDNFFWLQYLPQIYAKKNDLAIKQSKEYLASCYGKLEGKLEWYCLDYWSERLRIDIVELKRALGSRIAYRPEAENFLKYLRAKDKAVYLATNAHRKSLEIKMLNINFGRFFCGLSSSHDFGFPKEDQRYWHLLEEKYSFDKERTLFIDDSVKILKSARKFGIKYCLGISQPDLSRGKIDCTPFEAIDDFRALMHNAN